MKYFKHLLLIFVLAFPFVTFAQGYTISIAPDTFELQADRGQVLQKEIKILNSSSFAIPFLAKVSDFSAMDETGQMIFIEDPENFKSWFKIENPNFILEPGETRIIKFKISIPQEAEFGGKYAVMLFEPQLPEYYSEGRAKVVPVPGVLFLLSVGKEKIERPVTVVEFSIPEKFHLQKLENFLLSFLLLCRQNWTNFCQRQ